MHSARDIVPKLAISPSLTPLTQVVRQHRSVAGVDNEDSEELKERLVRVRVHDLSHHPPLKPTPHIIHLLRAFHLLSNPPAPTPSTISLSLSLRHSIPFLPRLQVRGSIQTRVDAINELLEEIRCEAADL